MARLNMELFAFVRDPVLVGFLEGRLIDYTRFRLYLFKSQHQMTRGFTPCRHVFLDAFIIGHDFEHLSQWQLFDLFSRS